MTYKTKRLPHAQESNGSTEPRGLLSRIQIDSTVTNLITHEVCHRTLDELHAKLYHILAKEGPLRHLPNLGSVSQTKSKYIEVSAHMYM